jgi:D-alanyl-D-alanine carboxypeptidase/D-alanyl-D-alanine-endopeptidase (penicillin-binding protein 4)
VWRVTGDLLLDRSEFSLPKFNPAEFDGEPLKPYNVGPDPLMLNFKAVKFILSPPDNPKAKRANVTVDPPLPTVKIQRYPNHVKRRCGDWWVSARPRVEERGTEAIVRFNGRYAATCGSQEKYLAVLDIPTYVHGMFTHYFQALGGTFSGKVKSTVVPFGKQPLLTYHSDPLSDVVYDINKRSNNIMARQLFYTLSSDIASPPYSLENSRRAVDAWLTRKGLSIPGLFVDNGAGLSRKSRVTATGLLNLLLLADQSDWFPEFFDSLPIAGVDGTLRRRFARSPSKNQAYLKSGYLSNVRALAGYVDDINGKRYAVVLMVNHRNAKGAAPAIETIINDITQGRLTDDGKVLKTKKK